MLKYYFALAVRSFRQRKVLTALAVLAVGLGIGASMTMICVLYAMSGDPLPGRSAQLFYPLLDPGRPGFIHAATSSTNPSENFTWVDANNLLRAHQAERQAMMAGGRLAVYPERQGAKPFYVFGRYVSTEFFEMFGAPFQAGAGWAAERDAQHARVVVLNSELAYRLFGNGPAVGRTLRFNDTYFRVAGVLQSWHPQPMFYGGLNGDLAFKASDEFFLPLTTALELDFGFTGSMSCWGESGRTGDQCAWLQFWVQLTSPSQVSAYRQFLSNYWHQQQAQGRDLKPVAPELIGLMDRLHRLRLVPTEVKLQLWLALGFLGVCILNTVGLLLAKFLSRSGEISVRRAMGARQRDIFLQFGVESGMIGLAGGALGLGLAYLGLWSIRQRPDGYAQLAHLDTTMLLGTVALSVLASVAAGLLPAWRACRIAPALQIKVL